MVGQNKRRMNTILLLQIGGLVRVDLARCRLFLLCHREKSQRTYPSQRISPRRYRIDHRRSWQSNTSLRF